MPEAWITKLADDERRRDQIRALELSAATEKAELVLKYGRQSIDELRAKVACDVEAFRLEFPGDPLRDVVVEETTEGFLVRKSGIPSVSLSVNPRWEAGGVGCHYCFMLDNGLPARREQLDLVLASNGNHAPRFRHVGTGELFANVDALSEYLLTPVFTGRPR